LFTSVFIHCVLLPVLVNKDIYIWLPLPRNCLFSWGYQPPSNTYGSLGPHESAPKRHFDRFSHFCTVHQYDERVDTQTDTQTTLRATAAAIGRILCTECRRCGL